MTRMKMRTSEGRVMIDDGGGGCVRFVQDYVVFIVFCAGFERTPGVMRLVV